MKTLLITSLLLLSAGAHAAPADSVRVSAELQAATGGGTHAPLWLQANRYGLSSLSRHSGYMRLTAERPLAADSTRRWGIAYGIDAAVATHHTSTLILQQAYATVRYRRVALTAGARQQPMEGKDAELSTGAQCLGTNARPIPQLRLELPDYIPVPLTRHWLAIKGHIAFGLMTDGGWEEDFAAPSGRKYNKLVRYHQKAGYLRIGRDDRFPLSLTLGLEMGGQFGGRVYNRYQDNPDIPKNADGSVTLKSNLRSYWNIFTGSGADATEVIYQNAEGNILGSWTARLDWRDNNIEAGLYADHYFEDHSGMFFLDYDGYGTGDRWNEKERRRYFLYDLRDIMLGLEVKMRRWRAANHLVVEYVNTRYQSGPIYHDHTPTLPDHQCGIDNYYNHGSMPGWQHWGQPIGNPLYLAPLYNTDGSISCECNRFRAWHFALGGDPTPRLHYRVMLTWQRGWGTYNGPYLYPRESTSTLVEATYRPRPWPRLALTAAWAADFGTLRHDNSGVAVTCRYTIKE